MEGRGNYISLALKKFYKEERVVMEFTSPYIFEQNFITKRSWHTFSIIKNAMLANSKLFKEF